MNLRPDIVRQYIGNLLLAHPELLDDEEARALSIESETPAFEYLRMIEGKRIESASMAGAVAGTIAELELRLERFEKREKAMREIAFKIMQAAELKKIEMPEATYSIRNGQQKVMGDADPATLPAVFVRTKQEVDRAKIKDALKGGAIIPGFELSNSEPTLSVRVK